MIHWNKYADKYYVISHTINFDKRKALEKQFVNIDLKDFTYHYSVNPNICKKSSYIIYDSHYYCTIAHYDTIKEAYELGYDSIIIMEDDIRFLKDINEIEHILNDTYLLGDIVLFDYIVLQDNQYCLSDFYRLNRNGMKYLIDNIEDHFYIIDHYWTNQHIYAQYIDDFSNTRHMLIYSPHINVSEIEPVITISNKRICIQVELNENNKALPNYMYEYIGKEKININEYSV